MGGGQGRWGWGWRTEVADVGAGHAPLTRRAGRVLPSWPRGLRPSRQHDARLDRRLMLGTATVSQASSVRSILCPPASLPLASSAGAHVRPAGGARGSSSANRAATILTAAPCSCTSSSWPPQLLRQGGRVRPTTVHLGPQLRPLHLPQPGPLGPCQPPRAHCLQSPPPVRIVRACSNTWSIFQSLI